MSIFNKDNYDDFENHDGSILSYKNKDKIKERATEIASGFVSGLFEKDEEVWEEVRKIKERSGE